MHHKNASAVIKITVVVVDFYHPKNSFHAMDVWGGIGQSSASSHILIHFKVKNRALDIL